MPQQLPEIREADALPHIATIYADIKQSAALPQVNLIFRYFATHEGVLEWIWATLRPLYRSRELSQAAVALLGSIERSGPSPLANALSGDDLAACRLVLDSYNSGNPQNLIALTALVRALRTKASAEGTRPVELTPRSSTTRDAAPFPALPRRDELSPEAATRVADMSGRHPGAPGVIPSMYLHLALWPPALAAADNYLQPIVGTKDWAAHVARVIEQAGRIGDQLAPAIVLADDPPDAATLREVTGTVETFIGNTIPELITVGRLLAIE